MNSRRNFLSKLAVSAAMPALWCGHAFAQAPPPVKLEESDPVAMALGYKEDTSKVDAAKYPLHKPEQNCVGCALYQGKPGEPNGPCAAFGGKLVTAAGWCSVFAKKPEPVKP
ncbi:high-potential iron-sulfur protein [bacterium]|nr:high-potential iron-sulfur protein [bacterium]